MLTQIVYKGCNFDKPDTKYLKPANYPLGGWNLLDCKRLASHVFFLK